MDPGDQALVQDEDVVDASNHGGWWFGQVLHLACGSFHKEALPKASYLSPTCMCQTGKLDSYTFQGTFKPEMCLGAFKL